MTYEERYEAVFLARSWEVVRRIVASALVLLGVETAADATCIPENTLLSLRRLLRPAEAMLRRILVVEALKLGPIMSRKPRIQVPSSLIARSNQVRARFYVDRTLALDHAI